MPAVGQVSTTFLRAGLQEVRSAHPVLPQLLSRKWLLPKPDTEIRTACGFDIIHDDLLHPVSGGNKLRKLDALLPELQASGCTDVVRSGYNKFRVCCCCKHLCSVC